MPAGARSATIRVKAIIPKRPKFSEFYNEFGKVLVETRDEIQEDFALTTWSWNHDIKFSVRNKIGGLRSGLGTVQVDTRDRIYALVNANAKSHIIRPRRRNVRRLKYQANFRPKSTVRLIGSRPGGKFGPWFRPRKVMHPGHKGREFDLAIRDKQEPRFMRRARNAMTEGARKSGHKY